MAAAAAAAVALVFGSFDAVAQTFPQAETKACSQGGGSGDLSRKLSRSEGVICPPAVDPDIKAPTPEVGRMPVIPPPGTPGGDPSVRPK